MIKQIKKRDGSIEEFSPAKVNGWGEWAAKSLGGLVDWGSVVIDTVNQCPDVCTSLELQKKLIEVCLSRKTWEYNRMAGRLYASLIEREIYPDGRPTIKQVHNSLQDDGLMVHLDYSDAEYEELEKVIDHKLDLKYPHYQLNQIRMKYSLRNKISKKEYESPQFVFMRMAMALGETEPKETRLHDVKKWYEHFSHARLNAPTPNYVNLGTKMNGYASCCVYTTDDTAKSLAAGDHISYMMTVASAGIGSHIKTRSIGDPVRGGMIAHQGKLPYYRAMVGAIGANLQNGRGGAATVHYTAYDPEVEVIQKLRHPMTPEAKKIAGCHYSFGSNKLFARKVAKNEDYAPFSYNDNPELYNAQYSGDQKLFETLYTEHEKNAKTKLNARSILVGALTQAYDTGVQYLHFTDEMNRHTPFKDTIWSSNLCVAPETLILTSDGYQQIADIVNEKVEVWNGNEWSAVTVRKTGENQKLIRVITNSGLDLECTPYHKFYVAVRDEKLKTKIFEKRAHELKPDDKLIKCDFPVINGENELEYAYANGFYSADGCETSQGQRIYLYGQKRKLRDVMPDIFGKWIVQDEFDREYAHTNKLKKKFFVPLDGYSVQSKIDWFAGLCDGDGTVTRNGKAQSIQISSVNKNFLMETQLMLQTIGISSKVTFSKNTAGEKYLPANDGTGGLKKYNCQQGYRLLIGQTGIVNLHNLGFKPNRLVITDHVPNRECEHFVRIVDVIDEGRYDDTYCFEEPKRHMGVFNGILTGQCQEIAIPSNPYDSVESLYSGKESGEIGLCSLGGVIVPNIESDEQYAEVAYYALKMIDKCIHKSDYIFKSLEKTAKSRLSAGVGIIGLAHLMAKKGKKYDDLDGRNFVHELNETHMYHLIRASLKLSKEYGLAPWMHKTKWPEGWLPIDTYNKKVDELITVGYKRDWEALRKEIIDNGGIRNSVLVAHMPGESSTISMGTTNGLYPIRETYIMKTNDTLTNHWAAPDGTKLVNKYQSAWNINSSDMIKFYAVVQKWTDQGISADLYVKLFDDQKVSSTQIIQDYLDMVKYGLKSRYYVNSKTSKGLNLDATESAFSVETQQEICESCSL